jgi:hypothetical protein
MDAVRQLLVEQSGVISRKQALAAGLEVHDVRRLVRRREWVRVHPGVFVDHTGELTWLQRAWVGVLALEPAALVGESALRAAEGPGRRDASDEDPIHVGVDRKVVGVPGVKVHRMDRLADRTMWNRSPPRLRYDDAVLDLAAEAPTEFAAVELLSRAVQSRRTTASRLIDVLNARPRIGRRDWLSAVLEDVASGTCSVLEHGFLTRVERPHGLEGGERQSREETSRGTVYRDRRYANGFLVELDGRLFHDTTRQRDSDLDRDLEAALTGALTARLGWGQVFDRPCWTAARVGHLAGLVAQPCSPECEVRSFRVIR